MVERLRCVRVDTIATAYLLTTACSRSRLSLPSLTSRLLEEEKRAALEVAVRHHLGKSNVPLKQKRTLREVLDEEKRAPA